MTKSAPRSLLSSRFRAGAWAAVALLMVLISGLTMRSPPPQSPPADPPVRPASAPMAETRVAATPWVPAPSVTITPSSPPATLPRCPHQHLDLSGSEGDERACVSATRMQQNGSVRSHRVAAEGLSTWHLSADMAGEKLVAVRLRQAKTGPAPERWFVCEGKTCEGGSLSPPDGAGERLLSLANTRLLAVAPESNARQRTAAPAQRAAIFVTASLTTPRERSTSALACPGGMLAVVESQGSTFEFCPLGGAGFELADDDTPQFVFRNLEGRNLVVALAADGSVKRVQFGPLTCDAPACGGVVVNAVGDGTDPTVERQFSFSGTTLRGTAPPGRTATLNGGVTMPSQP